VNSPPMACSRRWRPRWTEKAQRRPLRLPVRVLALAHSPCFSLAQERSQAARPEEEHQRLAMAEPKPWLQQAEPLLRKAAAFWPIVLEKGQVRSQLLRRSA
jgi:hypothetical protein